MRSLRICVIALLTVTIVSAEELGDFPPEGTLSEPFTIPNQNYPRQPGWTEVGKEHNFHYLVIEIQQNSGSVLNFNLDAKNASDKPFDRKIPPIHSRSFRQSKLVFEGDEVRFYAKLEDGQFGTPAEIQYKIKWVNAETPPPPPCDDPEDPECEEERVFF